MPISGIIKHTFKRPNDINMVHPVAHFISAGTLLIEIVNASAAKAAAIKSDRRKIAIIGSLIRLCIRRNDNFHCNMGASKIKINGTINMNILYSCNVN